MQNPSLSMSNVINITLSGIPASIATKNVNNVALFTIEKPSNVLSFTSYIDPLSVASDYGTNSNTAAMATAIFAQSPNLRSGTGVLQIIPLNSKLVTTSGYFTTVDLTTKLAAIELVSAGDLKVTIDGTAHNLLAMDFHSTTSITQVAGVLQAALTAAGVAATVTNTSTQIIVTSNSSGTPSTVTLGQASGGSGTDMSGSNYFNTAGGTATGGTGTQTSVASATSAYFTTADITSKVAAIIGVSSGDLKVTLNGTAINLTGIDFTACTTIADIAAVLQTNLPDVIITSTTTAIRFKSKKVGLSQSSIVLASVAGGTGTDVSGANYLNVSAGSTVAGTNSAGETIVDAISRTSTICAYTGIITNLEMIDTIIKTTADVIQALDMIWVHHVVSGEDIAGIGTTIKTASDTHTRLFRYSTNYADANIAKAAYVGRMFSTNFSGSNTAQTANMKSLAGITPDYGITQTQYLAQKVAGIDSYVSYEGDPEVISTGGNLYFDQIYSRTAIKFQLQVNGYNFLKTTNTKVPQTEKGMDGLKGAYAKAYKKYVTNGTIGEGLIWNSSQTFGDPEDLKRNITDKGFYQFSQPIAQQDQNERETRVATLVQGCYKEAGAIHSSDVFVSVEP